jgi:hypothetical protein
VNVGVLVGVNVGVVVGVVVGVAVGVSVGLAVGVEVWVGEGVGVDVGLAVGVGVAATITRRYSSPPDITREFMYSEETSPETVRFTGTVPVTPPPVLFAINLWSPAATGTPPLLTVILTTLPAFNVIKPVPEEVVSGGTSGSKDVNCSPLVPLKVSPVPAPVLSVAVEAAPEHIRVCVLASVSVLVRPDRSNVAPPAISTTVEFGIAANAFSDSVPLCMVVRPLYVLLPVNISLPVAAGTASIVRPLPDAPEMMPPKV